MPLEINSERVCRRVLVQVYNNLHVISEHRPVEHNKEGSFLTMWSMEGLVFGIINVIGNFGTVFVDQAYCESSCL